ncbi:MAG TPA: UDP-N-acetylmuramoyl-L-alanyl-D-glutamate--2,6-diaminopimelate ligase [Thermomicrobiales bacterium]|nr:UDP-N-acetylmuramoyl-L-alanyl-D-glutamate--2,6-diaminopimelate ligase [Thermomicrobiales bacterium]
MATGSSAPSQSIVRPLSALVSPDWTVRAAPDRQVLIQGLTHDSRRVKPGDLFVALRGGYFDGHQYIAQAEALGAAALFVEEPVASALPQVIVRDTRAALATVAARFYGHPSRALDVIGITGTDGKTTTSYLVEAILGAAGMATGVIGTVSVRIGPDILDHETRQTTPESDEIQRILHEMVDAKVDCAIVEATSHGLDLHRLDEVTFRVGAVTNITREHLEHHGTVENYRRAKGILFERVAESGGTAVINLDDEGAREMHRYAGSAPALTFSMAGAPADIVATNIELSVMGSSFDLATPAGAIQCDTPLVGGFNVANALCAAGVALALDVELDVIAQALSAAPSVPGRMAVVDEGQPFRVIVDYAHTPESLTKVLQLLRSLNPASRIICVSGSAGERDIGKRPIQGTVSQQLADISIFTTEDPRFEDAASIIDDIAAGAREAGGIEHVTFERIVDREEAIQRAFTLARPDDIVLLAGKGHEQSIIWGLEKRPWDEATVARTLLRAMGSGRG